jgi:plasmid stabilization system protein ParE
MYQLKFSRLYKIDATETRNYIRDTLENPKAASDLMAELKAALQQLKEKAERYAFVREPELAYLGLRSYPVKHYKLYYVLKDEDNLVKIVRFLYDRRDWVSILKDNPEGK